jgi:hypothetical protein
VTEFGICIILSGAWNWNVFGSAAYQNSASGLYIRCHDGAVVVRRTEELNSFMSGRGTKRYSILEVSTPVGVPLEGYNLPLDIHTPVSV